MCQTSHVGFLAVKTKRENTWVEIQRFLISFLQCSKNELFLLSKMKKAINIYNNNANIAHFRFEIITFAWAFNTTALSSSNKSPQMRPHPFPCQNHKPKTPFQAFPREVFGQNCIVFPIIYSGCMWLVTTSVSKGAPLVWKTQVSRFMVLQSEGLWSNALLGIKELTYPVSPAFFGVSVSFFSLANGSEVYVVVKIGSDQSVAALSKFPPLAIFYAARAF